MIQQTLKCGTPRSTGKEFIDTLPKGDVTAVDAFLRDHRANALARLEPIFSREGNGCFQMCLEGPGSVPAYRSGMKKPC